MTMENLVSNTETNELQINEQQKAACGLMKSFCSDTIDDVFILKGSASTGKTTIVWLLVEHLESKSISYKILAPTNHWAERKKRNKVLRKAWQKTLAER